MEKPRNPSDIALNVMSHLRDHAIDPTPPNYAVWYMYVTGENPLLNKEMDQLITHKMPFTHDINRTLYERFVVDHAQRKHLEETKQGAQRILSEVLRILTQFSGDTQSYEKELDVQIDKMSNLSGDQTVQSMIKGIVEGARALKESGTRLNERLSQSEREMLVLKNNLQRISAEAQRDFLTGVANRKAFDKVMEEYIRLSKEKVVDVCLLMIDVDHFKQFNDKFGHLIGDEVLKVVAKVLTETVRGNDIVARYGGEEFAVILPITPLGGAMIVAEKIRSAIASHELRRKDTGDMYGQITVSIGVASFAAKSPNSPNVIKRADDALYRAKKAGRNQVIQETLEER